MKLIWNIVKKDLRRLWAPLALWALLVAAQVGVGMNLLLNNGNADVLWFSRMAGYSHLLLALDLLFAGVLMSALVHDDSLVGTRVFWRTRPISGGRLMAAKLGAATLVFGAVPTVIWLPWWLTCRYGWREIIGAVPEILGTHAVAIMAALLVATLTESLGRFLAWAIMLAVTVATLLLALATSWPALSSHAVISTSEAVAGLRESRAVVAFVVLLVVIAIVVIQQFLARRPAWAFAQALAGFGVAALVCTHWPWDWSVAWHPIDGPPKFEHSAELSKDITLAVDQARLWQNPTPRVEMEPSSRVAVGLLADGVPEGLEMYGRFSEQTWRWADGGRVYRVGGAFGSAGSPEKVLGLPIRKVDPDYLKWLEAWRLLRPSNTERQPSLYSEIRISRGGANGLIAGAPLTHPQAARIQTEAPGYTINAQFGLVRPKVEWELSLRPGDRHWVDRVSLRMVRTTEQEGDGPLWLWNGVAAPSAQKWKSMQVVVIESRPTSCADGLIQLSPSQALRGYEPNPAIRGWIGHWLVNRDRGNMTEGYGAEQQVRIGTVELNQLIADFRAPNDWRGDGQWESQPHWFEHATLLKTTAQEVARFRREVKVDRFEVQP